MLNIDIVTLISLEYFIMVDPHLYCNYTEKYYLSSQESFSSTREFDSPQTLHVQY